MRPLSNHIHKTLLKVGDRTVIQMIVDSLLSSGITRIAVVTGYREAELRAYLSATYPGQHFDCICNERYEETNNIYSLALALESLPDDRDIVLVESDLIFDPEVLERLVNSPYENVALVDRWRPGMDGTVVAVNGDSRVIASIIPPHLQGDGFDFSDKYKTLNIYRFSSDFCSRTLRKILSYYAKAINDNCYYELILGILIYMNDVKIHAEVLDGEKWTEIDDPNDLDIARFMFAAPAKRALLDRSFGGYWRYDIVDFRFIRNMYFPTGAIVSELRNNLPNLIFNYGSTQAILNRKLATFLLLDSDERVTALNGLSQIYPLLREHLAGRRVVIPEPSFGEYARMFPGADTYSDQVGFDTGEILGTIGRADAIVVVNPNNPTGSLLPTKWVYELAASHPGTLVIADESFIDFSGEPSLLSLLEAKPLKNVVLLVSLSKSLGVPGMRLGYAYCADAGFTSELRAKIPIWNMNSLAEYFLEVILKHRNALASSIARTVEDRNTFEQELERLPVVKTVYPSGGNFLLVSLGCGAASLERIADRLLLDHGIYIKGIPGRIRGEGSFVRLAVRTPGENAKLVRCLGQIAAAADA